MPKQNIIDPAGKEHEVDLPFKLRISNNWEAARTIWFWGKEPETIEWIKRFENDATFWDIGANIGVYSLYCAAIHENSKIWAFEPGLQNYEALLINIYQNGFNNKIHAEYSAISDKKGSSKFFYIRTAAGSSGGQLDKPEILGHEFLPKEEAIINTDYGDNLIEKIPVPNYIKIDVDGQEDRIINGMAEKLLWKTELKGILVEIPSVECGIAENLFEHGFIIDKELTNLKERKGFDNNVIWKRKI